VSLVEIGKRIGLLGLGLVVTGWRRESCVGLVVPGWKRSFAGIGRIGIG
jgi:hypothetical protein